MNRLRHEVVAPRLQSRVEGFHVALRRQEHNRRVAPGRELAQTPANLQSVHARHTHVEQYAIRRLCLEQAQCLFAVLPQHDLVILVLQYRLGKGTITGVVVYDKYLGCACHEFTAVELTDRPCAEPPRDSCVVYSSAWPGLKRYRTIHARN